MRISLTGDEEVLAAFQSLVPRLQSYALAKLAQSVYEEVERGVKPHEVPKPGRTNPTRKLWQSLFKRRDGADWLVGHDTGIAPYAEYVVNGAPPHKIFPKNRRALRWPSGVGFVFAKFVNHPGYKGDPYIKRAADRAPAMFQAIISKLSTSWYNTV